MPKRDYVGEIAKLRSRTKWDSPLGDVSIRLSQIENAFASRDRMPVEMLRYFPVAIVACLEAYCRAEIREVVDHGSPFTDRAAKLDTSKSSFDIELLRAIGTKAVTLGELTAHLLPLNNLADVNRHFSVLFDADFLEEIKRVRDRWKVEIEKQADVPIIEDAAFVFTNVKRCFELRHIFAHESATAVTVGSEEIENCFTAAAKFLRASQQYCQDVLYPDAPR